MEYGVRGHGRQIAHRDRADTPFLALIAPFECPTESVGQAADYLPGVSTPRQVIPGTLVTAFRDFGDRDSRRLDIIPRTLATRLIGETNYFPISFGR